MGIAMFHKPDRLKECLELKARTPGGEGVLLAGGTDVLVHMHEGKLHGSQIADLSGIAELKQIQVLGEIISLGGGCTFTDIQSSPFLKPTRDLQRHAPPWDPPDTECRHSGREYRQRFSCGGQRTPAIGPWSLRGSEKSR